MMKYKDLNEVQRYIAEQSLREYMVGEGENGGFSFAETMDEFVVSEMGYEELLDVTKEQRVQMRELFLKMVGQLDEWED